MTACLPCGADDLSGALMYLSALVALACSAGLLPGTPSMNSALGPGLRSFRRQNSLQGGADHRAPRMPLDAARSSKRYCASSRILKVASASRSKGCKQSACNASMAAVRGALTPANKSRTCRRMLRLQRSLALPTSLTRSWKRNDGAWPEVVHAKPVDAVVEPGGSAGAAGIGKQGVKAEAGESAEGCVPDGAEELGLGQTASDAG